MKSNAIRIHENGGPDVLQWEEVDIPDPAAGEAQIWHTAVGLNFIDVYHRTGLYPTELPTGLGSEAAGVVGSIASQWASRLGATVIGIVSTDAKAELATSQGCDHIVMADEADIPGAVKKITGGEGVATREKLLHAANELFDFVKDADPGVRIGQKYALRDAAQAHIDLAARKTTGSTILLP
jgi:NADPH:quinone reductase-like Zn-dependent oxidoreductase